MEAQVAQEGFAMCWASMTPCLCYFYVVLRLFDPCTLMFEPCPASPFHRWRCSSVTGRRSCSSATCAARITWCTSKTSPVACTVPLARTQPHVSVGLQRSRSCAAKGSLSGRRQGRPRPVPRARLSWPVSSTPQLETQARLPPTPLLRLLCAIAARRTRARRCWRATRTTARAAAGSWCCREPAPPRLPARGPPAAKRRVTVTVSVTATGIVSDARCFCAGALRGRAASERGLTGPLSPAGAGPAARARQPRHVASSAHQPKHRHVVCMTRACLADTRVVSNPQASHALSIASEAHTFISVCQASWAEANAATPNNVLIYRYTRACQTRTHTRSFAHAQHGTGGCAAVRAKGGGLLNERSVSRGT
jgi:hypothetical protein